MDTDGSAYRLPLEEVLMTHGPLFSRRPRRWNELMGTLDLDRSAAHSVSRL
jgi:hypothetical protein